MVHEHSQREFVLAEPLEEVDRSSEEVLPCAEPVVLAGPDSGALRSQDEGSRELVRVEVGGDEVHVLVARRELLGVEQDKIAGPAGLRGELHHVLDERGLGIQHQAAELPCLVIGLDGEHLAQEVHHQVRLAGSRDAEDAVRGHQPVVLDEDVLAGLCQPVLELLHRQHPGRRQGRRVVPRRDRAVLWKPHERT